MGEKIEGGLFSAFRMGSRDTMFKLELKPLPELAKEGRGEAPGVCISQTSRGPGWAEMCHLALLVGLRHACRETRCPT